MELAAGPVLVGLLDPLVRRGPVLVWLLDPLVRMGPVLLGGGVGVDMY